MQKNPSDLPSLFNAEGMKLIAVRAYAAARNSSERWIYAGILRRARAELHDLESLYQELGGVFAGDRTATKSFLRILANAAARNAPIAPSLLARQRLSSSSPAQLRTADCAPPAIITRSRIRLIAYGIAIAAPGDERRQQHYAEALRGIWARSRFLEHLFKLVLESRPGRDRMARELERISLELADWLKRPEVFAPREPGPEWGGLPGEGRPVPGGDAYPNPDNPFPWPGPDDGPLPELPGFPPGLPPEVPPGGPPGSGFDPDDFYDDPCNHLAVTPPAVPRSTRSDNVTSVSPSTACPGNTVTITGHSFGATRPPDITLMFGAHAMTDADIVSWSDTQIVIRIPPEGLPAGCVGFRSANGEQARHAALNALNSYRGALGACLGSDMVPLPYIPDKPDCTSANSFAGTYPVIHSFLVNGQTDVVVEPGDALVFAAKVDNALTLTINVDHPAGGQVGQAPNNPAGTIINVAPLTGKEPKDHVYYLNAFNACGKSTATVNVQLRRRPALKITALEVVQAIQRCDISGAPVVEVPLVARRRTVVRAWIDPGISDGFNYGGGENTLQVTGELRIHGSPPTIVPTVDPDLLYLPVSDQKRDTFHHSLNFDLPWGLLNGNVTMTVKARGSGKWAQTGPGWEATATRTATFQPRRQFTVAYVLIQNKTAPAPSIIEVDHLIDRFPIAADGYIVKLVPGTFFNPHNLGTDEGWDQLWSDVAEMSEELVHDYDVLIGIFKPDPGDQGPSMRAGMTKFVSGTFNNKAFPPVAIAQIDDPLNATHELIHCLGIGHAPCPPPIVPVILQGQLDSRLSGILEEPGVNARTHEVVRKGDSAMLGMCPGNGHWPSIKLWELMYTVFA